MANRQAIDAAVALAEAETGVRGGGRRIPLCVSPVPQKHRIWTETEEQFIRENLAQLSDEEIGQRLSRSAYAVKIHRERELRLPARGKAPTVLTAEDVATGTGVDGHSIHKLMDSGRMPSRKSPVGERSIRLVDRAVFIRWLLEPTNWIYVKPDRVGQLTRRGKRSLSQHYDFVFWEQAGALVRAARRKWKDAWLTPGQVLRKIKCPGKSHSIAKAIKSGVIVGKRWGNWWILKSSLPPRGKTLNVYGIIVDRSAIRKTWRRKDVCRRGHRMVGENVYRHPSGRWKACRRCQKISLKKYEAKNRRKCS